MAFYLEKQKTTSTPYILIDEERNYMTFQGRSFHENVYEFFKEIHVFLDEYLKTNFATFTFDCEMDYFNSSTVKVLLNIILKMDKYASKEKKIILNWITTKDNEMIIDCGEDFKEEVANLTFNTVIK